MPEKARPGPVSGPRGVPVLDWIVMDVIDVPFEVDFILDLVLPEPPLPDPVLTFSSRDADGDASLPPAESHCSVNAPLIHCQRPE